MNSKKTAKRKRAVLPREFCLSKPFLKDWDRLSESGRYDMNRLKAVMMLLIQNEPLPPEHRDHALAGEWLGYRECHIGGDFLLVYKLDGSSDPQRLTFVRSGTHAELFR